MPFDIDLIKPLGYFTAFAYNHCDADDENLSVFRRPGWRAESINQFPLEVRWEFEIQMQAERETSDWAKRLKSMDIATEVTALRDEVAKLSASVGELVGRQTAEAGKQVRGAIADARDSRPSGSHKMIPQMVQETRRINPA